MTAFLLLLFLSLGTLIHNYFRADSWCYGSTWFAQVALFLAAPAAMLQQPEPAFWALAMMSASAGIGLLSMFLLNRGHITAWLIRRRWEREGGW